MVVFLMPKRSLCSTRVSKKHDLEEPCIGVYSYILVFSRVLCAQYFECICTV